MRWVQLTNWVQVREGLEGSASRLWTRAFGTPSEAAEKAEHKTRELVHDGSAALGNASGRVTAAAKNAFGQVKTEGKEIITKAMETGKDKANVDIAAEDGRLTVLTPVERALQERFEKPEAKVNKTVEEALKERYTPMDKRDNTVLRGL